MSDEFYKMLSLVLAAIFGSVPSVFAYLSLRASQKNSQKIDVVVNKVDGTEKKLDVLHDSVNGKMEKLLQVSKVADTATGKAEGKAEEKQDQAEREDKK